MLLLLLLFWQELFEMDVNLVRCDDLECGDIDRVFYG